MLQVEDIHTGHEYEHLRNQMRRRAVALRKLRRVQLGDRVAVTFENRDTVLFRLHETIRDEGITEPEAIEAECEAYAALLPSASELSAVLEISVSPGNAAAELKELAGICEMIALVVGDDEILATVDDGISSEDMVAPTCYVRFELTAEQRERFRQLETPVVLRIQHPAYQATAAIDGECRRLLTEDFT